MSPLPVPPAIVSGDELYDSLMAKIEPELLIANLPKITELTKNETVAERQARAERYARAFEAYDKALRAHVKEWNTSFHRFKTTTMKTLEQEAAATEDANLSSLEDSI